jgi:hypothetical protein
MNRDRHRLRAMNFEQKITKATKTDSVGFLCFLRFLLMNSVLSFIIYTLSFPLCAQPLPQAENRFLFIINTSSAMRPMTNGIQEAVLGLIRSQMQGQLRDGDTFGIWTYDSQLHPDFAMQVWSSQNQGPILQTVSNWLAERPYQNSPHLEKVLPAARRITAVSRVVTLIFIFDGSETMQGTGFDKDINALHQEIGRQMRADHIPFVTVLAAHDGKFFDYRVRTPASISLPQTANFFPPAQTNAVAAVAAVAATNAPPPVVAAKPPEPRHLEIVLKPTPLPKTNPPPVAVSAPVAQSAPEKTVAVLQPASTAVQPAPKPVQTATNIVVAPTPNLNPNPNPNLNSSAHPETPPAAAPSSNPQSAMGGRTSANPQSPSPAAPPETSPPPHPAPLAVPTAVALPSSADHLALLVIAFSLVTIAVVLVLLLIRRSRTPPSLISQSMDRPR